MDERVRQLTEVLNGPHSGRFKPTRRLAALLDLEYRDFSKIDQTSVFIRPDACDYWGEEFPKDRIKENTLLYGIRFITQGKIFKSTFQVLTIIGYPSANNRMPQGRVYSLDERTGRGSAHFGIDAVTDKTTASKIGAILEMDPTLLNEALVLTEWGYHETKFSPYQYFIALDDASAVKAKKIIEQDRRLANENLPVFKTQRLDV